MTLTALAGMPVRLAVAPEDTDTRLYIAEGSLVELANHPLHGAWYADPSRPSLRRASCTKSEPLAGSVIHPAGFTWLRLNTPGGERTLRVDSRSRITNRPAYQPELPGQQVRLRMLRCGRYRVADRIRFMGATIQAKRYEPGSDSGTGVLPWIIAAAVTTLIGVPLLLRLR